jgi:putative aldouronate transport system substrate-binding protein
LRLCDWHASQYGSTQNVFIGSGIKGVDYTLQNGIPTPTQQGSTDSAGTTISYLSGPPFVFINAIPEATKAQYAFSVATSKVGVNDDSLGLYSATNSGNGASLGTTLADAMTGIVLGRQPVSSWKDVVSQWRQQGGDKIRSEFEAAYAQAHK